MAFLCILSSTFTNTWYYAKIIGSWYHLDGISGDYDEDKMKDCDWGAGQWLADLLTQNKLQEMGGNGALVPALRKEER